MNLRDIFKKGPRIWFDGHEKLYDVDSGKADVHPLSKVFMFIPFAVVLSCMAILLATFSAPPAMHLVKSGLASIYGSTESLKPVVEEPLFSDVHHNSKYFDSVAYLKKSGIISGYSDNSLKPDDHILRAELVKTLVTAKRQFPLVFNNNNCFSDVKTQWFAPAVCLAKSKGWIVGFDDGTFRPDQTLTREDAMNTLVKAFKLDYYPGDVLEDEESLSQPVTRGEAFQMLYRVL